MMEEINIWWEGPFNIDDILENKINKEKYENTADRIGIYQIYGTHPLYGSDKLLYIGRTKNKNGFQRRLNKRWVIENGQDSENIKIYLGTIFSDFEDISEKEENFIDKAEVLLINALKPAFNSSNIQSADKKLIEQNYVIYNHNNYRDIYPILSSSYFWNEKFFNILRIDELASKFNTEVRDKDNEEYYMFDLLNEKIWVGVYYDCWEKTNNPFHIEILKENINNNQKKEIEKQFKILDYENENKDCFYISITDNLKFTNIEEIKQNIEKIEKILKT
jgi:hypothetical protein